jgi:hypothetical protein
MPGMPIGWRSLLAFMVCLGPTRLPAHRSAGPPPLAWLPRVPLEGSVLLLGLIGRADDSVVVVRGELAGEPLHFERVADGFRAIAAVPLGVRDSVTVHVMLECTGGVSDTVAVSVPVRRRRVLRERLRAAPDLVQPPESLGERIRTERDLVQDVRHRSHDTPRLWREPFVRPRPGAVTGRFGVARVFNGVVSSRHLGVDFAGRPGAAVQAANRGVVVLVADLYLTGTTVLIDHGAGLVTGYLHLSRALVAPGDTVARGQLIGHVGASGRVTGPHLHWLAAYGAVTVDPLGLVGLDFSAPLRQEDRR